MYLLREGGGGVRIKKINRNSEIDLMHFGGTYSHSVLAHAQNNGTAHSSSHNSEQTGGVVAMYN